MDFKAKIFFGLLLISIFSCGFSETKKLDNSLRKTIDENNCQLELKSVQKNDEKSLHLKLIDRSDSLLKYGKVLFDFYNNSSAENLFFDTYSISSNNDVLILQISREQMKNIVKKKKVFDQDVEGLCDNKNDKFLGKLSSFMLKQIDTVELIKILDSFPFNKENEFEGFSISENKFISFSRIMNNRKVFLTYSLEDKKNSIYGFSIY